MLKADFSVRPLTAIVIRSDENPVPHPLLPGWSGEPVQAWRVITRFYYWYQLVTVAGRAIVTREDTTAADWVGAYLDLRRLAADAEDFTKFWLDEVELERMPRNWLRWAVDLMQNDTKITAGNPVDTQHATYLLDCDLFLSADARYIRTLQQVGEDAPFSFAEPRLVNGDSAVPILERILAAL